MLVILPPSETKATGGDQPPLNLANLFCADQLTTPRRALLDDLAACSTPDLVKHLKLSEKSAGKAETTKNCESTPTMPAYARYTGVLYDALDAPSLSTQQRENLLIGSALFGLVAADDLIPDYKLSGSMKIPQHTTTSSPTMRARWRSYLEPLVQQLCDTHDLVWDLRSGTYLNMGTSPDVVSIRVESENPDGTRQVVSHHNKFYKGQAARVLLTTDKQVSDLTTAARLLSDSLGIPVEVSSSHEVTMVVTR